MNFFLNQGLGHGNSGVEHAEFYRAECFLKQGLPFKLVLTDLLPDLHTHLQEWGLQEDQVIGLYDFLLAEDPFAYLTAGLSPKDIQKSQEEVISDDSQTQRIITTQSSGHYQIRRLRKKTFHSEKNIYLVEDAQVSLVKGTHQVSWSYRPGPGEPEMQDIHLVNFQGQDYYFWTFSDLISFFIDQLSTYFGQNTYWIDRGTFYDEILVRKKNQQSTDKIVGVVHANHLVSRDGRRLLFNNFYQYMFDHLDDYDAVIVATEAQKKALLTDLSGYTRAENLKKIVVIPVGGIKKLGHPQTKAGPAERWRLVTASRLHEEKHVNQIIAAVQRLIQAGHEIDLTIYGAGAEEQRLQEQIKAFGLEKQIRLAGLSQQLVKDLSAYHLFVSASYSEGFGLTYLEALSQGLPVATYANAFGAQELIHPGQNGYLASFSPDSAHEEDNVRHLAQAIVACCQDYEQLSAGAIASCRPYLMEKLSQKWVDLEKKQL